jgi:hypothetical protein
MAKTQLFNVTRRSNRSFQTFNKKNQKHKNHSPGQRLPTSFGCLCTPWATWSTTHNKLMQGMEQQIQYLSEENTPQPLCTFWAFAGFRSRDNFQEVDAAGRELASLQRK